MDIHELHPWNVTYKEAVKIQKCLRDKVIFRKIERKIKYIAGLDVSYAKGANTVWAGVDALKTLEVDPDLIFCDGQGIAHPRGLGLASHLGVLLHKPTIGCAKSPLIGKFDPVGKRRGEHVYLRYQNRVIGAVVRTRSRVKPVFVSPGYGVILKDCIRFTLETCPTYRIPEPTRQAHLLVNSVRCKSGELSDPI
jgi:deoxyribonuclease V